MTQAGIISTAGVDNGTTVEVNDVTGFQTSGSMMAGMLVTGTFAGEQSASCAWINIGADSGGCGASSGNTAFDISVDGDTFISTWRLNVLGDVNLVSLYFDGISGNTVFDRGFGGQAGTAGTANGRDANGITLIPGVNGSATYVDRVATNGAAPVNDIFARVQLDFTGAGLSPQANAAIWTMDTDNVGLSVITPRAEVGTPEQDTWTMVLAGVVLVALGSRHFRTISSLPQ